MFQAHIFIFVIGTTNSSESKLGLDVSLIDLNGFLPAQLSVSIGLFHILPRIVKKNNRSKTRYKYALNKG